MNKSVPNAAELVHRSAGGVTGPRSLQRDQAEDSSILASERRCVPWEWVSEPLRVEAAWLKNRRTVAAVCVCGCVWGWVGAQFFFLFLLPPGPISTMLCLCRGAPTDKVMHKCLGEQANGDGLIAAAAMWLIHTGHQTSSLSSCSRLHTMQQEQINIYAGWLSGSNLTRCIWTDRRKSCTC